MGIGWLPAYLAPHETHQHRAPETFRKTATLKPPTNRYDDAPEHG